MTQSTKTAFAVVGIVVLAGAFWLLLLSPKRDKAGELSEQVAAAKASLTAERERADAGAVAKKKFPRDYQQLILLGKAVPAEAETASLMVQLNALGRATSTPFLTMSNEVGTEESESTTETGAPAETTVADEPPLGSKVGPAGFRAMPMKLTYAGGYFALVGLMNHLDTLVTTAHGRVVANGRLLTIDSFSLTPEDSFPDFNRVAGHLNVTSYTTPPEQGLTAGASPTGPSGEGTSQ